MNAARRLVSEERFSFDNMMQILRRGRMDTVDDLIDIKVNELKDINKPRTAKSYSELKASLHRFSGNREIQLVEFDKHMIDRYVQYMKSQGNSLTTIGIRLRNL